MIFDNDEHSEKALLQIFVTLFGIMTFVSETQPIKTLSPISVILFGIIIFVSDEQFEKA